MCNRCIFCLQSPYFASMFSGSWKEANEKVINIEIADSNITLNCKNSIMDFILDIQIITLTSNKRTMQTYVILS